MPKGAGQVSKETSKQVVSSHSAKMESARNNATEYVREREVYVAEREMIRQVDNSQGAAQGKATRKS
uniref:Uncharacterized protein n=1 Tax=Steinernema glaseri TaxID=37863 RepID=A0A1I7ZK99_9BILA